MTPSTRSSDSPFLNPGSRTKAESLAILHLSRDNILPVYLQTPQGEHDGYAEGAVVNTRYGSFPHSTMLGVPWGSQVRASMVDTGSRGRKRKRPAAAAAAEDDEDDADADADAVKREQDRSDRTDDGGDLEKTPGDESASAAAAAAAVGPKQAVTASSGFLHVLPPTPELWTMSLPHRTQVVYTPDYSYILHRIRARPGTRLIEAGAGSGSFSHAAARAVYNGVFASDGGGEGRRPGKVFSFEYDPERYRKMEKEISDHKLENIVQITHRDVYKGGFLVDGKSPEADAVFLDLPAPWDALPHLARRREVSIVKSEASGGTSSDENVKDVSEDWVSPLNPRKSVHICTFSPCIEQVTRTVSTMRRMGWVDIEMVEIMNRRLITVRERIGLHLPAERRVNNTPKDVDEALAKLAEIEEKLQERIKQAKNTPFGDDYPSAMDVDTDEREGGEGDESNEGNTVTNGGGSDPEHGTPLQPWMDGRLVTRGEPEIKTHTSYLVFATLPREWTEEDEAAALAKWPVGGEMRVIGARDKESKRREHVERFQRESNRKDKRLRNKGDKNAQTETRAVQNKA